MNNLVPIMPPPDVYELEYSYWPWGKLLQKVSKLVADRAPNGGAILDYMCGTGYLLHSIGLLRPDLKLMGCTLEPYSYVEYANSKYPEANVMYQDAFDYKPQTAPDIIICTAGIHHVSRDQQPSFINKVASELNSRGFLIVGEEVIRSYQNENERRLVALDMGVNLLKSAMKAGAPDSVLKAAIDLICNDLFEIGEYKISYQHLKQLLSFHFEILETIWIWPAEKQNFFGDVITVCEKRYLGARN